MMSAIAAGVATAVAAATIAAAIAAAVTATITARITRVRGWVNVGVAAAAEATVSRRRVSDVAALVMTAQTAEGYQHDHGSLHCIPPRCEIRGESIKTATNTD
jgi:pheromone shutdown protein TraB